MPKQKEQKKFTGTFKSAIDLDTFLGSDKVELPKKIPVLPKGEFMTMPYGNMVLDNSVFEQMVGNFKANIRRAVPIDVDHSFTDTKAAGWIKELVVEDDGLWAVPDWNKLGKELVGERIYRMISAEWSFDYIDPQKSTHHGAVLVAVTLTNRPLMQSMPTISASDKNLTNPNHIMILFNEGTNMNIKDILSKPIADRTEEEVKFLTDNAADFTDEQKSQIETEEKEAEEAKAAADLEEAKKKEDEEAKAKAEKEGEGEEEDEENKEAGNKDITIKASEFDRLKKVEEETIKASELKAATEFSSEFIASDKGGKVAPAGKDALIKLSQSLNKEQKELLKTVLAATVDQKITDVKGKDNEAGKTASEQYDELISKYMSEGKTASEANRLVRTSHKDVYKAFTAESK